MNIRKLLEEPLLHFIIVGATLFFIYYAVVENADINKSGDVIVISSSDIERLAYLFEKTWKRQPNDKELKGLVDDYLEEEVLYREAMKLGLDKNDMVVRRRMRQKMEFFVNDLSEHAEPTEKQLEDYLEKNKEKYRIEPLLTFKHIYFKSDSSETSINDIKNKLNNKLIRDTSSLGDNTILSSYLKHVSLSEIDNRFGHGFSDKISNLDTRTWQGPEESAYGYHLIFIEEKIEAYDPKLSDIRDEVKRNWKYSLQKELEQEYLRKTIDQYNVQIQWPDNNK